LSTPGGDVVNGILVCISFIYLTSRTYFSIP